MSARLVVSASTAMISDATVRSKPVSRLCCAPLFESTSFGPVPTVTPRRWRSHTSPTRFHVMVARSIARRAKRARSPASSSSGRFASSMPSLRSRRRITGENGLSSPVFASFGQSRAKSPSSDCESSW